MEARSTGIFRMPVLQTAYRGKLLHWLHWRNCLDTVVKDKELGQHLSRFPASSDVVQSSKVRWIILCSIDKTLLAAISKAGQDGLKPRALLDALREAYAIKAPFPYLELVPELRDRIHSYLTKKDIARLSSTSSSMRADLVTKGLGTICISGTVSEVLGEIQDFNNRPHIVKVARSLKVTLRPKEYVTMDFPIGMMEHPRDPNYRHLGQQLGYALGSMERFLEELVLSINGDDFRNSGLRESLVNANSSLHFEKMKTLRLKLGDRKEGSELAAYLISRCPSMKTLSWWDSAWYEHRIIRIDGPVNNNHLTSFTLGNTSMGYNSKFIRAVLLAFPQLERFAMFGDLIDDVQDRLAPYVQEGGFDFGKRLEMLSIPFGRHHHDVSKWPQIAGFFLGSLPKLKQIQFTPSMILGSNDIFVARKTEDGSGNTIITYCQVPEEECLKRWPFNSC